MQGMRVRSMVREIRSHMLWGNWARAPQLKSPCSTTNSPCAAMKTQHSPKQNKKKNNVEGLFEVSAVPLISSVLKEKIHFDEHLPYAFLTLGALSLLLPSHPSLVLFLADCFFNKFMYLIFWLWWVFIARHGLSLAAVSGATLHCDMQASRCGGSPCCVRPGSRMHRLHSPATTRRIFPDQRSNPCPLHWQVVS